MENANPQFIMLRASDVVVFKGISAKNGKPYASIKMSNNSTFDAGLVQQAVALGARVNPSKDAPMGVNPATPGYVAQSTVTPVAEPAVA